MKPLSVFMLTCSLVLGSTSAHAGDPPKLAPQETTALIDLLSACNRAQEASAVAASDKDQVIALQASTITALDKSLADERSKRSAIIESKELWFVAGLLTAALSVYLIKPVR